MPEKRCWPHDYDDEGYCRDCDAVTGEVFWKFIADGLGVEAPKDTLGLRLRPGKEPEWIKPAPEPK